MPLVAVLHDFQHCAHFLWRNLLLLPKKLPQLLEDALGLADRVFLAVDLDGVADELQAGRPAYP
jgi:hypothetical protein